MVFLKNLSFGGRDVAWNKDAPNTVLIGSPGTGKTLLLRMLMRSMLFDRRGRLAARAVVHDPKREMFPVLVGMGVRPDQIRIVHPLDARSKPWNIAADFRDPSSALELATLLIPRRKQSGTNDFFYNGARSIVQSVVTTLQERAPCAWTLNDLFEICPVRDAIKLVLKEVPDRLKRIEPYLNEGKAGDSVLSTVESELAQFMAIAPANHRALQRDGLLQGAAPGQDDGSLRRWLHGTKHGVLLISAHPDHEEAVGPFNNAVIASLSRYVLGQEDNPDEHTFFFIDEARTEYPLPKLDRLVRQGRSKRAHVVTVFHTYEGMKGVYGEVADELMGASLNVGLTSTNSPDTRRWALNLVGVGPGVNVRAAKGLVDSWFNQMGTPSVRDGIDGIFKVAGRSPWFGHASPRYVSKRLAPTAVREPGFVEVDQRDCARLSLSDSGALERLGVKVEEDASNPVEIDPKLAARIAVLTTLPRQFRVL